MYACYVAETEQTIATSALRTLTVNRADPTVNLLLNGEARDLTVISGDSVDIRGALRMLGVETGMLALSINEVEIARGLSEVSRTYTFNDIGVHRVIASYEGTQNYTSVLVMRLVTVTAAPVLPVLTFAPPTPINGASIGSPLRISIESTKDLSNAAASTTDAMGRISPVVMTRIDARHYQASFTLSPGVYTYRATATDVEGLTGTTETRSVTIATGAPVITFVTPPTPVNDVSLEGSFTVAVQSNEDLSSAILSVVDAGGTTNTPMTRVDARNYRLIVTLTPETYTYSVSAVDLMGTPGTSETRRITILVPRSPVIIFVTPPTPLNSDSVVSPFDISIQSNQDLSSATVIIVDAMRVETTVPMSRVDARHYGATITLAPGDYTFHVSGVRISGETGASEERSISISSLVVAHTFSEYAFGGLVTYQRTAGPMPFEPTALFVGTRAAPMVYGGTIQRSYNGIDWTTVLVVDYPYFRGVDRNTIEGIFSLYGDPRGWIYAGTGGWGPAQGIIFKSTNGGTAWSNPWEAIIPYSQHITAIGTPWDPLHWGSDRYAFWEWGGGYLQSLVDSSVVKILPYGSDTIYFTSAGTIFHMGSAYPYGGGISWLAAAPGTITDASPYLGTVYFTGLRPGGEFDIPTLFNFNRGGIDQLFQFDGYSSIGALYAASNGKIYFATSTRDGRNSVIWSVNAAAELTREYNSNADQINYLTEFNGYLYIAGVNEGTLTLYRTISPLR